LYYYVIANKLLEDIINSLQSKGGLKQFLGILAVPHLETLILSDKKSEELDNSMRCVVRNFTFTLPFKSNQNTTLFLFQNLKHLDMDIFSDEFFASFIPKLSKLLDISCSDADDSSLEVIGTCCKHLR
jgi:hypothetical protein